MKPRRKLLIGVGGDYLGKWLPACVAAALPDVECRFVGQLWSNGHFIRQAGLPYRHWPWWSRASSPLAPDRNLTDFQVRHMDWRELPTPVRQAYGALQLIIEQEVCAHQPDALLYLTAETAMGRLMHQTAVLHGRLAIGLQTVFKRDKVLVHTHGVDWWQALHDDTSYAIEPNSQEATALPSSATTPLAKAVMTAKRLEARLRWLNVAERSTRAALHMTSLDTLSTLVKPKQPLGFFPNLGTAKIGSPLPPGLALIALHRPVLTNDQPDWLDLIRFALTAVPESWPLVLRPHPDEPGRAVPAELLTALKARRVWLSRPGQGPSLEALIQHARVVLTLNSAVGMEALLAGVRTLVLTPSYYAARGMAEFVNVTQAAEVRDRLANGDIPPPDADVVQRFVEHLDHDHLIDLPARSSIATAAHALGQRIEALLDAQDRVPPPKSI